MYIPNTDKPDIQWDVKSKILVLDNVISSSMCDELIQFGNGNVQEGINKYPESFGISFHSCRIPLDHAVHTALQSAWNAARDFSNIDISFVEHYEIKRYTSDDFFGRHIDNYYGLTVPLDRKITMSIQLTDDTEFEGGELVVVKERIKLKKGSAVCFPSFLPHEVAKITQGVRWSLIGWAWGPYWK